MLLVTKRKASSSSSDEKAVKQCKLTRVLSHVWDGDHPYLDVVDLRHLIDDYLLDTAGRLLYVELDRRFTIVAGRYNPQERNTCLRPHELKDAVVVTRAARAVPLSPEVCKHFIGESQNDGTFVSIDSGSLQFKWLPDTGPHLDHEIVLVVIDELRDNMPIAWEWIPTYQHQHVCEPEHIYGRSQHVASTINPMVRSVIGSSSTLKYAEDSPEKYLKYWAVHLNALWLNADDILYRNIVVVTGSCKISEHVNRWAAMQVGQELDRLHRPDDRHPISLMLFGDAYGADELAQKWATEQQIPWICLAVRGRIRIVAGHPRYDTERPALDDKNQPITWKTHGKAAGPLRNNYMLSCAHARNPHFTVVGFPGPSSKGTVQCLRQARTQYPSATVLEFQSPL